ncbi:hypothetical protein H696_02188 [Fonticula alba]|uniref:GPI mannosyltransferase 2 n=1 Tax=Fonticula alba TaxID=691883 RepID=A0A058ZBE2_FONAL|nr:hypothetical protein H696_02188 [Fonticula alba]KCV71238.1 hypothetical protein H696_02188 [Fonticula alba]|eukprot:XP_009494361.1 hypothetical protein H696_02188 [Fonticula alba]
MTSRSAATARRVALLALGSRIASLGLLVLPRLLLRLDPDDTSTALALGIGMNSGEDNPAPLHVRAAEALIRWDAIHMHAIAAGTPALDRWAWWEPVPGGWADWGHTFEQQHAFFPGLPAAARAIAFGWAALFSPDGRPSRVALALWGVILSNAAFVLAAVFLFLLSQQTFRKLGPRRADMLGVLACVAFCLSPGGAFMSSMYTESLFGLCVLAGLWCRSIGWTLPCGMSFFLACLMRSNGTLLVGYPLFDAVSAVRHRWAARGAPLPTTASLLAELGRCAFVAVATLTGALLVALHGYREFCTPEAVAGASAAGLTPRPWCTNTLPLIYGFIQKEYWDVGLFRYWRVGQIPNFVLALPAMLLAGYTAWRVVPPLWRRWASLGLLTAAKAPAGEPVDVPLLARHDLQFELHPHLMLWFVAHLAILLSAHVQIIHRFAAPFPAAYWVVASMLLPGEDSAQAPSTPAPVAGDPHPSPAADPTPKDPPVPMHGPSARDSQMARVYLAFGAGYQAATCILFGHFYPPA